MKIVENLLPIFCIILYSSFDTPHRLQNGRTEIGTISKSEIKLKTEQTAN